MLLDTFADQDRALFQQTPAPANLDEGVDFMRKEEADERFDDALEAINPILR